jgi:hypothetical protein
MAMANRQALFMFFCESTRAGKQDSGLDTRGRAGDTRALIELQDSVMQEMAVSETH